MTFACHVDDVPRGEGRQIVLAGRRIAIFRSADGWFATDAACPHAGGPLADGIVCDRAVICPLHERRFALDSGEPIGHAESPVDTYPVEVRGDGVFVAVAVPVATRAA